MAEATAGRADLKVCIASTRRHIFDTSQTLQNFNLGASVDVLKMAFAAQINSEAAAVTIFFCGDELTEGTLAQHGVGNLGRVVLHAQVNEPASAASAARSPPTAPSAPVMPVHPQETATQIDEPAADPELEGADPGFGLPAQDLAALGHDNVPGRHSRGGRSSVVLDSFGRPVDENGNVIVDEAVMTAQDQAKHNRRRMSAWCVQQFRAGQLDLDGNNLQHKLKADQIAKTFDPGLSSGDVLRVIRTTRYTHNKNRAKGTKDVAASSALPSAGASKAKASDTAASGVMPATHASTSKGKASDSASTDSRPKQAKGVSASNVMPATNVSASVEDPGGTTTATRMSQPVPKSTASDAKLAQAPMSNMTGSSSATHENLRALLEQCLAGTTGISPSKPGGKCDVMERQDPVMSTIAEEPELPYLQLYDNKAFKSKADATVALDILGYQLERQFVARDSANPRVVEGKMQTQQKGSKLGIYGCGCSSCTTSLEDPTAPFQLVLRQRGNLFQFVREEGQHKHGYLCCSTKPITAAAGHLQEVQDFVQSDPTVKSAKLLRHLVYNLHFDKPADVQLSEEGTAVLGKKWSKTMDRVRSTAWSAGYGPELNELAVWVKMFNETPDNGYAVIRLKDGDDIIAYDGITGDMEATGEFVSFTCVFRPTLMTCMQTGLQSVSGDGTFLTVRSDLNMLVCDGICPAATNGLTIAPVAMHLSFGESHESYVDLWTFLKHYDDGVASEWLSSITLHADRGPGCCMTTALKFVFPDATFASCAFHVFKAMQRNVKDGTCIDRTMFMALVTTTGRDEFAMLLQQIKHGSLKSYEYICDSNPNEYCRGHPGFKPSFNCCVNNSAAESEMMRLSEARKSGKSILGLVTKVAQVVRNVQNKWLDLIRTLSGKATKPTRKHELMPKAQAKLRDLSSNVNQYEWAAPAMLDNIMHKGGKVQLVSDFKGRDMRSTYTLEVQPNAKALCDLCCSCPLKTSVTWKIACVHMVKLVSATSDQTSADPHELLADPIWYVERCKIIFEEHLTKGALPNCNAIPDQVSTGITIKKLVTKPGQKSKKRLVASSEPVTNSSRHSTSSKKEERAAKTFGLDQPAIEKTCTHRSPLDLDDVRKCSYCQAERVKSMMDESLFSPGSLCELVYENAAGTISKHEVLYYEPQKSYVRGPRYGRPTGQNFGAFLAGDASHGHLIKFRFESVLSVRVLPARASMVLPAAVRQLLNGSSARKASAAKARRMAQQQQQQKEKAEQRQASKAQRDAQKRDDDVVKEVRSRLKKLVTEVQRKVEQEEVACRAVQREEARRKTQKEKEQTKITREVAACLTRLVGAVKSKVEQDVKELQAQRKRSEKKKQAKQQAAARGAAKATAEVVAPMKSKKRNRPEANRNKSKPKKGAREARKRKAASNDDDEDRELYTKPRKSYRTEKPTGSRQRAYQ